ncbi:hypothetical protein OF83DRAFT_1177843 [Amylostereum chailletii]|nr:hypothetical protein OF83DRAFT_1177843 [Amylostereum chailletii]
MSVIPHLPLISYAPMSSQPPTGPSQNTVPCRYQPPLGPRPVSIGWLAQPAYIDGGVNPP